MTRSLRPRALAVALIAAAALVASASAGYAKTPKPKPTAAGSLAVSYQFELPHFVTSRFGAPLVTESPDGIIYFAHGTVVYRVAGQTTTVVQRVRDRIYGLVASSDVLVVETPSDVFAYSRFTGKRVADWEIEQTGVYPPSLVANGDVVWAMIDTATAQSGPEPGTLYELRVGHGARVVTTEAAPVPPVADSSGDVFFVTFGGKLESVTPGGLTHKSADSTFASATLAYINGMLIAEIDSAKTVVDEINPSSLTVVSSHGGTAGDYYRLAVTSVGGLSLTNACGAESCAKASVRRITPPDERGPSLTVAYGAAVMGPNAVVLEMPPGAKPELVGIQSA
jgi:hypothetical protein